MVDVISGNELALNGISKNQKIELATEYGKIMNNILESDSDGKYIYSEEYLLDLIESSKFDESQKSFLFTMLKDREYSILSSMILKKDGNGLYVFDKKTIIEEINSRKSSIDKAILIYALNSR